MKPESRNLMILRCASCRRPAVHVVEAEYGVTRREDAPTEAQVVIIDMHYRILRCDRCDLVGFQQVTSSNVLEEEFETRHPDPDRRGPKLTAPPLPEPVRVAYHEAVDAFDGNLPRVASRALGLLAEALCADQACPGATLEDRLQALAATGRVPADEALLVANLAEVPQRPSPELVEGVLDTLERWLYLLYAQPEAG